MSQHYFEATHDGHRVTITLGWDRPLHHYFMLVEKPCITTGSESDLHAENESEDIVYSNLNERNAFTNSLNYYKNKLDELGISVPTSMFEQVKSDQIFNVGNRCVCYEADGSFQER
jgi:hypothetical protein